MPETLWVMFIGFVGYAGGWWWSGRVVNDHWSRSADYGGSVRWRGRFYRVFDEEIGSAAERAAARVVLIPGEVEAATGPLVSQIAALSAAARRVDIAAVGEPIGDKLIEALDQMQKVLDDVSDAAMEHDAKVLDDGWRAGVEEAAQWVAKRSGLNYRKMADRLRAGLLTEAKDA